MGGRFPWLVVERVDVEAGAVWMSGNDGCNDWSTSGTFIDGRFESDDGVVSTAMDCGPGTFGPRGGDVFVVRDEAIDVVRDGRAYSFGPDAPEVDASTLLDGRRFLEVSTRSWFPASVEFDAMQVSGFDGCALFTGSAEYDVAGAELVDVESECSTSESVRSGSVVEHLGSNTVEIRLQETVVGPLVAIEEAFVPPTSEWLIGTWRVGSGHVTFLDDGLTVGHCDATWGSVDGLVEIDPWGDCLTGLFPGDLEAEELLALIAATPLVHRLLPPSVDPEYFEQAAVLDARDRALRMVRLEESPPSAPNRVFALEAIDGRPFLGAVVPSLITAGASIDHLRGFDGCIDFSVLGTLDGSSLVVDRVEPPPECADTAAAIGFAPAAGATITIDATTITVTDAAGRTGVYTDVTDLARATVSELLDPASGSTRWTVDGLTVDVTGPLGTGVIQIGACERAWFFDTRAEHDDVFGPLRVEPDNSPPAGCVEQPPTHEASGLLELLRRTTKGDGADVRLTPQHIYLVWDTMIIRLNR